MYLSAVSLQVATLANDSRAAPLHESLHFLLGRHRCVAGGRHRERPVSRPVLNRGLWIAVVINPKINPEAKLSPPPTRSRISRSSRCVAS